MKFLFAFVIVLFALQLNAQCDKVCGENSAQLFNTIEDNQAFEAYDEVFLFKNSGDYFVLNCKRDGDDCTCVEKKHRHCSFSANKCSFDKLSENLRNKYVFADIK
ncbi:MAG: hypothetical protein C0592_09755 [Marinilabiliales bacterium]|nr:MAG: hypothetical protein C0592_09755 [Marinilabiliales bacterium]